MKQVNMLDKWQNIIQQQFNKNFKMMINNN